MCRRYANIVSIIVNDWNARHDETLSEFVKRTVIVRSVNFHWWKVLFSVDRNTEIKAQIKRIFDNVNAEWKAKEIRRLTINRTINLKRIIRGT